jgi:hypothetical protein
MSDASRCASVTKSRSTPDNGYAGRRRMRDSAGVPDPAMLCGVLLRTPRPGGGLIESFLQTFRLGNIVPISAVELRSFPSVGPWKDGRGAERKRATLTAFPKLPSWGFHALREKFLLLHTVHQPSAGIVSQIPIVYTSADGGSPGLHLARNYCGTEVVPDIPDDVYQSVLRTAV